MNKQRRNELQKIYYIISDTKNLRETRRFYCCYYFLEE